jgi:electron transfer flavoprotein beta subunit
MIIAVCMKQVKRLYARTGKDPDQHFVGPRDYVSLNNPLDEVALEQAVRIKEFMGYGQVWALSVAEELEEKEARRVLAMGSDRFVHIHDPAWGKLDAWTTSMALSRAVQRTSADLVLCGARSLDLGRGEVGCYLAALRGFPFVSSVVSMERSQGTEQWIVRRSLDKGYQEELECRLPLVLGVERSLCEPRYPSHRARLQAEKEELLRWDGNDLDLTPSDMRPRVNPGALVSPRPKPKRIPVPDGAWPARKRISFLLSRRVDNKAGEIVRGELEELAQRLVEFLEDKGLIPREQTTSHMIEPERTNT